MATLIKAAGLFALVWLLLSVLGLIVIIMGVNTHEDQGHY